MKKTLFLFLLLLTTSNLFSQKNIDNPNYGLSNIPGNLTKIELTAEATILHFDIKFPAGYWIFIPKESYIQDVKGGEKYVVTKAEGIPLETKYTMPASGEVRYQLYFPKVSSAVYKVDFGVANNAEGNWSIYDIVINESKETSLFPKELRGNWFQADGSNQWDFGFYVSNAVVDKALWNYKKVEISKNNYAIVLERNGKQKTVFAQIDKKGGVKLGSEKQNLQSYNPTKIENPNYKLANDEVFADMVFKSDSATYSGVIKDYTPRAGQKSGMVYVNSIFTGNQDSYLVKIADDGSFSVKFPINHPQFAYIRLGGINATVYFEPGKETFQLIDKENALFMGDCARINTELKALERTPYEEYGKLNENILATSPQDYKNACLVIKNKEIEALNTAVKKQFISQKSYQIKKLNIEFEALETILGYGMNRESSQRNPSSIDEKLQQQLKLDKSYYDFITQSILNDEVAVVSSEYSIFINRLRFATIFRNGNYTVSFSFSSYSELSEQLQKLGITLTSEELQLFEAGKEMDKINSKAIGFYTENGNKIQDFEKNHKEVVDKLQKEKPEVGISVGDLASELKKQGIVLTSEEKKLLAAFKSAEFSKKEIAIQKQFTDKYGETLKLFNEKYKAKIEEIITERNFDNTAKKGYEELNNKLNDVFGVKEAFVYDLLTLQTQAGELEKNSIPYTDKQLKWIQGKIKHPFLSHYIVAENDKIKAKIEANKSKSGFTINTIKKTEGDELFESMIAKFKGKVIYVDFWATWCGPCMQGIKEIAPLKKKKNNENVVFLYITNQTSPENTWNNKIPDIKGEHYRVTQDEWNYLSEKFKISGIPHYVLVNKKGEIVNPDFGHNGNESLKKILEEQMK